MSAATPTGAPDCPDCGQPMQAAPGNPAIWLCPTCRMGWGVRALIAKAKAEAMRAALEGTPASSGEPKPEPKPAEEVNAAPNTGAHGT